MKRKATSVQPKDVALIFAVTGALLSIPLIAMQFTDEVAWTLFDFVVMGMLLSGTGSLIVLASRKIRNKTYRAAAITALIGGLLIFWIHLAVGIGDLPFGGS
jgi:hypothetical protein